MSLPASESAGASQQRSPRWRSLGWWSRMSSPAIIVLVGTLLVQVLFEGWAQTLTGGRHTDATGTVVLDAPAWPKDLKNALYLMLAAMTFGSVALQRRWREFRTSADLALGVLVLVMLLAALVDGSSPKLTADALFVYFRGVIVFYALRAAAPTFRQIRPVFWTVLGIIALNIVVALVQMVVGKPAFTALRWTELKWADTNRAQALLTHPNHLGHVLSLSILGLLAWTMTRPRLNRRWWFALAALALALSATQSRESILAASVAAGVIWLVTRSSGRRVIAAVLAIWLFAGLQIAVRPSNRGEWERRLSGVTNAFRVPSGEEHSSASPTARPAASRSGAHTSGSRSASPSTPTTSKARPTAGATSATPTAGKTPTASKAPAPSKTPIASKSPVASKSPKKPSPSPSASPSTARGRETRVLFYQQGIRLFGSHPLLGYGPGQFGGIVAEKHNPNWHKNPKFGPKGFDRHGFKSQQIDTFWLHLLVEVGGVGFLAYLAWLFFLMAPVWRRVWRPGRAGETRCPDPYAAFAIAAMIFVMQVAFLSPSFEDPMLPALLFTIVGLAWVMRPSAEPVAQEAVAQEAVAPAAPERDNEPPENPLTSNTDR